MQNATPCKRPAGRWRPGGCPARRQPWPPSLRSAARPTHVAAPPRQRCQGAVPSQPGALGRSFMTRGQMVFWEAPPAPRAPPAFIQSQTPALMPRGRPGTLPPRPPARHSVGTGGQRRPTACLARARHPEMGRGALAARAGGQRRGLNSTHSRVSSRLELGRRGPSQQVWPLPGFYPHPERSKEKDSTCWSAPQVPATARAAPCTSLPGAWKAVQFSMQGAGYPRTWAIACSSPVSMSWQPPGAWALDVGSGPQAATCLAPQPAVWGDAASALLSTALSIKCPAPRWSCLAIACPPQVCLVLTASGPRPSPGLWGSRGTE